MPREFMQICGNRSSMFMMAMLLLASAGTAGCGRSDAALQANLQKQLADDSQMAGSDVAVTVTEGIAFVKGETQTAAQQQRVVDIARAVKGLTEVRTDLRLSDTGLTGEVKRAIAADASVNQVPLRIEVRNAEVKLYSVQTNAAQRARLREIAGGVPGVTRVEDNMK